MNSYNFWELAAIVIYFAAMIVIGVTFFIKDKSGNDKDYFLGGRKMGPFVTAMSAQASDMSGWLLMGYPGSILALGFGQVWVAVGLALGTYLNWLLVAPRLRKFSAAANDSITVPQYLRNRFLSSNHVLQVVCAVVFLICFTVYVASAFKAGGVLFNQLIPALETKWASIIFAAIIIGYTFLGGYKAVCWTDFFQALLMLCAIVIIPAVLLFSKNYDTSVAAIEASGINLNVLSTGRFDWQSVADIISGLAWGLGYFGMPHILVRFMSIKKPSQIKKSRRFATVWVVITLSAATFIGILGRTLLPELVEQGSETVFIKFVTMLCPAFVAGLLLSAILAASMSTADSQLLVASSSFTSDIYRPLIRKNASDKEVLWVSRLVVVLVSVVAYFISVGNDKIGIMDLVSNAWAGFGAAFGPVILLSLFWKRFTYKGAVAGIIGGGLTVALWIAFLSDVTKIYELLPGFIVCLILCVTVSLIDKKPSEEVCELFEKAVKNED